jgi:hypothetical protein
VKFNSNEGIQSSQSILTYFTQPTNEPNFTISFNIYYFFFPFHHHDRRRRRHSFVIPSRGVIMDGKTIS